MNKNMLYRSIPKVDVLLENQDIVTLIENHHRDVVVDVIREEIDKLRNFIKENSPGAFLLISNTSEIIGKGFHSV